MSYLKTSCFGFLLLIFFFAGKPVLLKPLSAHFLIPKLNEPSEICYTGNDRFIILANKGYVYELDRSGKILNVSKETGLDFEGACIHNGQLYVSDESLRLIMVYNLSDWSLARTIQVHYSGPRNLGFESVAYNQQTNTFLLATEKNPQLFIECSEGFQPIHQFSIPGIREVSSMTFHHGNLYVLSDEQQTVFKVSLKEKTILQSWKLPVINPEGICFTDSGEMVIVSDDMGRQFYFKNPDQP